MRRVRVGIVVAAVFVSLLTLVGWWTIESHPDWGDHVACSCAAPPPARQLAAEADLVAAGTITDERSRDEHGGADYSFRISRVLSQHVASAPPTVTVHVSGADGCCGNEDGRFAPNSSHVLFLARASSGAFSTVRGSWGRMSLQDNIVTRSGYSQAGSPHTLDELAAGLAAH